MQPRGPYQDLLEQFEREVQAEMTRHERARDAAAPADRAARESSAEKAQLRRRLQGLDSMRRFLAGLEDEVGTLREQVERMSLGELAARIAALAEQRSGAIARLERENGRLRGLLTEARRQVSAIRERARKAQEAYENQLKDRG